MSGASATAKSRQLFAQGCEANGWSAHRRRSLEDRDYLMAAIVERERSFAATKNGKCVLVGFRRGVILASAGAVAVCSLRPKRLPGEYWHP